MLTGEYLYISRKECNRLAWGVTGQSKERTCIRNQVVYEKYLSGVSVESLADEYFFAIKTIYGIIAKMKL